MTPLKMWLKQQSERHRLLVAVSAAVVISTVITFVNMSLYYSGETSFLDLSRPGLEKVRAQLQQSDTEKATFSNTGSMDDEALKEFQKFYNERKRTIDKLGMYEDQGLSDESLRLVAPQSSTPE